MRAWNASGTEILMTHLQMGGENIPGQKKISQTIND